MASNSRLLKTQKTQLIDINMASTALYKQFVTNTMSPYHSVQLTSSPHQKLKVVSLPNDCKYIQRPMYDCNSLSFYIY